MERFHHHLKKAHSEGKGKKSNKFAIGKTGNKKLDDDFVYTQKHKNIWNSFCNFLDKRFAAEDLRKILDAEEEIARLKITSALLKFIPTNVGDLESEEDKRARIRAPTFADKFYASKKAAYLDGLKKLKQKVIRVIVLVLKHVDAQINLDLYQFLKSDPIKKLEPETKYNSLREYFSKHWGPHSSLDVIKIKQELIEMQGDDPGWRKYLQNFNYFVGAAWRKYL
jgi:hypothetical protein